jgi:hypothetical protein
VAQPIVDRLVGEQGVEHIRARAESGRKARGHCLGRGLTRRALGRMQLCERAFERGRAAIELDLDRRDLFLEQPLPRAPTRDRLLVEHNFFRLAQEVRAVAPSGTEMMAGEGELLVGEEHLHLIVGELCPLEIEEQQSGADLRGEVVDALHTRAARRIGGIARKVEADITPGPSDDFVDPRQLLHHARELRRVEVGDATAV